VSFFLNRPESSNSCKGSGLSCGTISDIFGKLGLFVERNKQQSNTAMEGAFEHTSLKRQSRSPENLKVDLRKPVSSKPMARH
jgi:hypothetical protein